jgi:hypothetical protein
MPKEIKDILEGPAEEKVEVVETKPEETPEVAEAPQPEAKDPEPAPEATPELNAGEPEKPEAKERDGFKGAYTAEKKKRQATEAERDELRAELDRREQSWRRDMQQIASQFAPKPPEQPAPNFYEDPDGWQQRQTQTYEQRERANNLYWSEQLARVKFGDDVFDAAGKEVMNVTGGNASHPISQMIAASPNPGIALVNWYQERQQLSSLQNPESRVELLKESLKDPAMLALVQQALQASAPAQAAAPKPAPNAIPSNFAGARSVSSKAAQPFSGPKPIEEVLGSRNKR